MNRSLDAPFAQNTHCPLRRSLDSTVRQAQPQATVSAIVDFLSVDSSINARTLGVAEIGALA
jgi:hypothetical protein